MKSKLNNLDPPYIFRIYLLRQISTRQIIRLKRNISPRKSRNNSYFPEKRNISLRNQIFLTNQNRNRFVSWESALMLTLTLCLVSRPKRAGEVSPNEFYQKELLVCLKQLNRPKLKRRKIKVS